MRTTIHQVRVRDGQVPGGPHAIRVRRNPIETLPDFLNRVNIAVMNRPCFPKSDRDAYEVVVTLTDFQPMTPAAVADYYHVHHPEKASCLTLVTNL